MNSGTGVSARMMASRVVLLTSADGELRGRLKEALTNLRWQVREAGGGAEAMACLERMHPEAMLVDTWLPDLEAGEFVGQVRQMFPGLDVLKMNGVSEGTTKSLRRNELLHAIRQVQESPEGEVSSASLPNGTVQNINRLTEQGTTSCGATRSAVGRNSIAVPVKQVEPGEFPLPGMIGSSAAMKHVARLVRLVAPRSAAVLIEGETGTGKELVAKALHKLSSRASKPFVVLNCAAIPEALLEAELFGHTRGAFTGAVQSRTGRIEAANGGTLFLDEIGEMPLALQAKMLRFLDAGELQRVGDNEPIQVDVRVVAATHQLLEARAAAGTFRLDLYHRLAVFPVELAPLRERKEDIPLLCEHLLDELGKDWPRKRISSEAAAMLQQHEWYGNVRELMHVIERATILCGESPEIGSAHVRVGSRRCNSN